MIEIKKGSVVCWRTQFEVVDESTTAIIKQRLQNIPVSTSTGSNFGILYNRNQYHTGNLAFGAPYLNTVFAITMFTTSIASKGVLHSRASISMVRRHWDQGGTGIPKVCFYDDGPFTN